MPRKGTVKKTVIKAGELKRGDLSNAEKAYISDVASTSNAEQIAKKLRRQVLQIRNYLAKIKGLKPEDQRSLQTELLHRPEWQRFKKQFALDEQEEFKHQYVQIMSQMKGDVMATEELQVFQVITLKILIDRTLEEQKLALDDMNSSYGELHVLRESGKADVGTTSKIAYWEGVYTTSKKTNNECADRYKIYSDKQDKMLHALKSTRDQRIKVWENADKSILGLVRLLVQEDQRELLGQEAEMMKIASQKERDRLAAPHKYADGITDQPLLTPETVLIDYEVAEDSDSQRESVEDVPLNEESGGDSPL
jgi:hypothetical protein